MAMAINVDQIVSVDYGNLVLKASPTGLLPTWQKYINSSAVAKNGFTYNPAKAKALLLAHGYKLGSNGYFTTPDGKSISLTIAVPSGWSDWMQAIQMISDSAKKVGIKITPTYPDFNTWQTNRNTGRFDLVIDNTAQLSDTPFTYYQYLFNLPILSSQTNYNFERVNNPAAWSLVQKLDTTPKTDVAGMKTIISKLQTITMQQLPEIPLWYNGIWSQASTQVWTDWPAAGTARQFLPVMWRGDLQMTAIDMISHVAVVPKT